MARWRVAPAIAVIFDQANRAHPRRSKAADGTRGDLQHRRRASDHNPDGQGLVCAGDITHGPAFRKPDVDCRVLASEVAGAGDWRLAYCIFNRRIYIPGEGWRRYDGENPHTHHCHISSEHGGRALDGRAWQLPSFGGVAPTRPVAHVVAPDLPQPMALREDREMAMAFLEPIGGPGVYLFKGDYYYGVKSGEDLTKLQGLAVLTGQNPQVRRVAPEELQFHSRYSIDGEALNAQLHRV